MYRTQNQVDPNVFLPYLPSLNFHIYCNRLLHWEVEQRFHKEDPKLLWNIPPYNQRTS